MSKPVILLTKDNFLESDLEHLKNYFEIVIHPSTELGPLTKKTLIENIKGKYALLCLSENLVDKDVIEAADQLKVVCTGSVGYEHLDIKELKAKGIRIGYSPVDAVTETVAEYAMTLLLASGRRIWESHNAILQDQWASKKWFASALQLCGQSLYRSNVGIIGYGRIGHSIAQKLKPFNIAHLYYFSRREIPRAQELGGKLRTVDEIMQICDFIIIGLSLNEETKKIINEARINMMKPNAVIVNIGRGGLIDQQALLEALRTKRIFGAGLDVFESEPLTSDDPIVKINNAVTTPHMAAMTEKCLTEMSGMVVKNLLAAFHNKEMPYEL